MAQFDQHQRLDSGLRFDQISVKPVAKRKSTMSILKLELRSKTVPEKIALGVTHLAQMAKPEVIAIYPVLKREPDDADLAAAQADLVSTNAEADAAEVVWKQKNAARDAAEAVWDVKMTARGNNLESRTPGDRVSLAMTGLPLRGAPAPAGPIGAPQNFRASMGDMAGEIDVMCDANNAASSLTVKYREHGTTGDYIVAGSTTKSKYTVTGLVSGKTYGFLAQFLGNDGPGPWSDETVKMAP
jgi:hypothetical protein